MATLSLVLNLSKDADKRSAISRTSWPS